MANCLFCREEFDPKRPWSKFCCDKCRNNYHADKRYEEKEKEEFKCPHCTSIAQDMIELLWKKNLVSLYLCNTCAKEFLVRSES